MRARHQVVSLFAAILLVAGCSGDGDGGTGPSAPSLAGRWTARVSYLNYDVVDFTLVEGQGGAISGSGFIQSDGQRNVNITGLHTHPSVSLTLDGATRCTGSFSGTFTDNNTISGTITTTRGDCRGGEALMLKRQ